MKTNYNFKIVKMQNDKFSEVLADEGSNFVYDDDYDAFTDYKSEFISFIKDKHPGYTLYSATIFGGNNLIGIVV